MANIANIAKIANIEMPAHCHQPLDVACCYEPSQCWQILAMLAMLAMNSVTPQ
jgi:hypothetical protein